MSSFNNIQDVWNYLDQIPMFSKTGTGNFNLNSIREFCAAIGNPQNNLDCIHVAGTNGKGTTCHLLESIYLSAGFKTGMFTSPHLLVYNERFRINGIYAADEVILRFFQEAEPTLETIPLTYFEISTALAFWLFDDQKVDVAIIETGLGGRLDATNIIDPLCSVITSIGYDHTDILGETLSEICREKAGIIKKNKPVVIGNLDEECVSIITQQALKTNSELIKSSDLSPVWGEGYIKIKGIKSPVKTWLKEDVNKWNVAISRAVTQVLYEEFEVNITAFIHGIEQVKGISARFEQLVPGQDWYYSGAHNEQALSSLMNTISTFKYDRKVAVISLMKDKMKKESLEYFKEFNQVFYVEQESPRAASFNDISSKLTVTKMDDFNYETILNELKASLVIFTGSFYFYPTIKRWLS